MIRSKSYYDSRQRSFNCYNANYICYFWLLIRVNYLAHSGRSWSVSISFDVDYFRFRRCSTGQFGWVMNLSTCSGLMCVNCLARQVARHVPFGWLMNLGLISTALCASRCWSLSINDDDDDDNNDLIKPFADNVFDSNLFKYSIKYSLLARCWYIFISISVDNNTDDCFQFSTHSKILFGWSMNLGRNFPMEHCLARRLECQ